MSTYLFERTGTTLRRVASRVENARELYLFLDYDGTVVPLRKTPRQAVPSTGLRALLRRLNGLHRTTLGIITGRSLGDIRKLLGIKGIVLGANHGFEILHGGTLWIHPRARTVRIKIARLSTDLRRRLRHIPRILIEDKRSTLSVHYRNTPSSRVGEARETVNALVHPLGKLLTVTNGKKVIEIRPKSRWGKGYALNRILKSLGRSRNRFIIYCGDDTTDEDAFRRLPNDAVTVRVGQSRDSKARYYVENVTEVHKFLRRIEQERRYRS